MKEQADLIIGVVGHTDATASLEYNMDLCRRRAEAVVHYLTSKHSIRLLAANAVVSDLIVVTRNRKDMKQNGVPFLIPK